MNKPIKTTRTIEINGKKITITSALINQEKELIDRVDQTKEQLKTARPFWAAYLTRY